MPITPQQIKDRKGKVTFEFAGESVTVEYPSAPIEALTKEQVEVWQEEVNAAASVEEGNRIVAGWVCEYISKWDCVESIAEDGTPGPMWPLSVDRVAELDATFLARVFLEVVKDANQSKLGGMAS